MKMRYLLLFLLGFLLLADPSNAQNTGYGGKRFLLKTNVLNGIQSPIASVELEYIFSRRFTFSVKGGSYNYKVTQRYNPSEYKTPVEKSSSYYSSSYNLSADGRTVLPDKASIHSRELELELRYYPGSTIPAPKGFFTCIAFRYASMDIKGNYYNSLVEDITNYSYSSSYSNFYPEYYYTYEAKGVTAMGYRIGLGYQKIWKGLISFGFKTTLDNTFFNTKKSYDENILSGVAKSYGSNVITLSNVNHAVEKVRNSDFFNINNGSSSPTKMSIGLSFSLQVGVLF